MKRKYILVIVIFTLTISINATNCSSFVIGQIGELDLVVLSGSVRPNIALEIKDYLRAIRIDVNVQIQEYSVFMGNLLIFHDYDLTFCHYNEDYTGPDMSDFLSESGSHNYFLLDTSIPYGQTNEDMLEDGKTISNFNEKQQHYYDWQQMLMDYIVPMLPFYSHMEYGAVIGGLDLLAFNLKRPFIGGSDNDVFLTASGKTDYTKACAVRKAICYAINREAIINQELPGFQIVHSPMYYNKFDWYYSGIIKYRFNLDKALEWITAAGYDITIYDDKKPVIGMVLNHAISPKQGDTIEITAEVSDNYHLDYVRLVYRINNGSWEYIDMIDTTTNQYSATFGPFEGNDVIDFYIEAKDISNNVETSSTHTFSISSEKPEKTSIPIGSIIFCIAISSIILSKIKKKKKKDN